MKTPAINLLNNDIGTRTRNESNLYKLICFIGFLYFFLVGITNAYYSNGIFFPIGLIFSSFIFLFIAIFFPFKKIKAFNKLWVFISISLFAFDISFLCGGGFLSPSLYIIFPLILIIILLTNNQTTTLIISLIIINYSILFIINYHWPEISTKGLSEVIFKERIISHIASLILSMLIINKIFTKYEDDKNKAKLSEQTKEAFLANMSHLIRTPLNGINGYAELLIDDYVPDFEKDSFKKRIHTNAKELHHMIFNLVDLSIIQEKSLRLKEMEFQLSEVIRSLQSKADETINEVGKQLNIEYQIEKDIIPLKLFLDADRLIQLIWNFLENSIYYSNKGIIKLNISIDFVSEKLVIIISDSGNGIEQHLLEQLKQQNILDRNQSNIANPRPGMGILISKGIIDYFGGKMTITSEINRGTHVSIEIPIKNKYEKAI